MQFLRAALLLIIVSGFCLSAQCQSQWEKNTDVGVKALKDGRVADAKAFLMAAYKQVTIVSKQEPIAKMKGKKKVEKLADALTDLDAAMQTQIERETAAQMKKESDKLWKTQDLAIKLYGELMPVEEAEYALVCQLYPEKAAQATESMKRSRAAFERLKAARKAQKVQTK